MANSDLPVPAAPQQKFPVPAPFYWGVRTVHATAPALVAIGNLESKELRRERSHRLKSTVRSTSAVYPAPAPTISLQTFGEHPDVATHKYADFLMLYAPYGWNWFFPKVPVDAMRKPVPRIHRDRISITRDSAEMCEEMLWERFFPDLYDESTPKLITDASTSNPAFEKFLSRTHSRKTAALAAPFAIRQQSDHVRAAPAVPAQNVSGCALSALRA